MCIVEFSNIIYEHVYTQTNILTEITLLKIRGIQKLFGGYKRSLRFHFRFRLDLGQSIIWKIVQNNLSKLYQSKCSPSSQILQRFSLSPTHTLSDGNIYFKREGITGTTTLLRVHRTKQIQQIKVQLHTNEVFIFPFRTLIARILQPWSFKR